MRRTDTVDLEQKMARVCPATLPFMILVQPSIAVVLPTSLAIIHAEDVSLKVTIFKSPRTLQLSPM